VLGEFLSAGVFGASLLVDLAGVWPKAPTQLFMLLGFAAFATICAITQLTLYRQTHEAVERVEVEVVPANGDWGEGVVRHPDRTLKNVYLTCWIEARNADSANRTISRAHFEIVRPRRWFWPFIRKIETFPIQFMDVVSTTKWRDDSDLLLELQMPAGGPTVRQRVTAYQSWEPGIPVPEQYAVDLVTEIGHRRNAKRVRVFDSATR